MRGRVSGATVRAPRIVWSPLDIEDSDQDATVVPPTAVALVIRDHGEVELAIPRDEELEWHPAQMVLAQLAIRFIRDPEWVQRLTDEPKASATWIEIRPYTDL